MIFSRGKIRNVPVFYMGNDKLDVVTDFLYLGLKLNYNNKLVVAQRDLCERASRAMFMLLKKAKRLKLPVDLTIDLFDKTVLPVLTYGCEVWGFDISDMVTKLQLKFYKLILKLKNSTPSLMVFGETGKYPVDVAIKTRMLCFWFKLVSGENACKLSSVVYRCLLNLYITNSHQNRYLQKVHSILNDIGLSNLWDFQGNMEISLSWFKQKISRCLLDQFLQSWYMHVDNDDIYRNYRMFKPVFCQEPFFTLLPDNYVISLTRFRTTNNALPVNQLRFNGVPRHERMCDKCTSRDVADEFHYLFVCPFFGESRKKFLPSRYVSRPNTLKFHQLFSSNNKKLLLKLKHFIVRISKDLK